MKIKDISLLHRPSLQLLIAYTVFQSTSTQVILFNASTNLPFRNSVHGHLLSRGTATAEDRLIT